MGTRQISEDMNLLWQTCLASLLFRPISAITEILGTNRNHLFNMERALKNNTAGVDQSNTSVKSRYTMMFLFQLLYYFKKQPEKTTFPYGPSVLKCSNYHVVLGQSGYTQTNLSAHLSLLSRCFWEINPSHHKTLKPMTTADPTCDGLHMLVGRLHRAEHETN